MMSGKTMDWSRIRQQWQRDPSEISAMSLAEVQAQDRVLQKQIRARDRIETIAAAAVALFFGYVAWSEAGRHAWMGAAFAAELVLWALWVPFRLYKTRRDAPAPRHDLPLQIYLARQRDMLLAQARMLARAWLWYVLPCMVGVTGLTVSYAVPLLKSDSGLAGAVMDFGYFVVIAAVCLISIIGPIALGVGIAWLNRRAARMLWAKAEQLDRHLKSLSSEDVE